MKRVLTALIVLVPLLATPANAQDFEKGLAAAESGDYETALREWRPLAKNGDAEAPTGPLACAATPARNIVATTRNDETHRERFELA